MHICTQQQAPSLLNQVTIVKSLKNNDDMLIDNPVADNTGFNAHLDALPTNMTALLYDNNLELSMWYWWRVTLPIYTTIQSKLRHRLHPFLSSSPHHSHTANVSLQSVLPIIIINMSSNSIPLQSISRWSLDSNDSDAHVNLRNQLHSQHPQCKIYIYYIYSIYLIHTYMPYSHHVTLSDMSQL